VAFIGRCHGVEHGRSNASRAFAGHYAAHYICAYAIDCRAWNVPSLPVKPCTMSLVFWSTRTLTFAPPVSPLCRRVAHVNRPREVESGVRSGSCAPVRRWCPPSAPRWGQWILRSRAAATTPLASCRSARMPPKNIDQHRPSRLASESRMRKAFLDLLAIAPRPHVEEVSRACAPAYWMMSSWPMASPAPCSHMHPTVAGPGLM